MIYYIILYIMYNMCIYIYICFLLTKREQTNKLLPPNPWLPGPRTPWSTAKDRHISLS
jgi:hypothetical protein